jgi:hypothetical protein
MSVVFSCYTVLVCLIRILKVNLFCCGISIFCVKDLNLFWMYLCIVFIAVICITIKSHQSNQTHSTTWRTFIGCKYSSYFIPFCNLQNMYMYNLIRLRTIYTKYWNSTTICHCGLTTNKESTHVLCSYFMKPVAFCSVLNNIYNKILRNCYLLQLNVFIFLLRNHK